MKSKNVRKLVAYYRVSTKKQEQSGLGLEAQKAAVAEYAGKHGGKIVAEYIETEIATLSVNILPFVLKTHPLFRGCGARYARFSPQPTLPPDEPEAPRHSATRDTA